MAFNWTDSIVGLPPVTDTDTVQKVAIGTRAKAFDPTYGEGEFIYLPGVGGTVVGSVSVYDEKALTTTLAVAATRGPAAVSMSINILGQYGWYQISGSAVVKANTVAAGTPAYSTAVGGQVDDAVVAGSKIDGMVFKTADGTPSAGLAVAQIERPSLNGNG